MEVRESLVTKTLFPTMISIIAAAAGTYIFAFTYFERDENVRKSISEEVQYEISSIREQIFENKRRIEDVEAKLSAISSDFRSSTELGINAQNILDRLEKISAEIRESNK